MKTILCLILLAYVFSATTNVINVASSLYYQEKYFRFLANNYDQIKQGNFWTSFGEEKGIGFKAKENFGSFILVKDWSMYSFKLTKIIFRPYCSYKLNEKKYDAEMQLIHTLDNGYYPPGKRMYLGINYLVISVPFKRTSDRNPSTSKLFEFLRLNEFNQVTMNSSAKSQPVRISPLKPIKLHHIIQHQPSLLINAKLQATNNNQNALYMIFTQYHYISETDLFLLQGTYEKLFPGATANPFSFDFDPLTTPLYRNWDNPNEVNPKPTLMTYNSQWFIKINSVFILIAVALLI